MIKILFVVGTRPEAIKMAPVVIEAKKHPSKIKPVLCVTGQHRQMVDSVLPLFRLRADVDLNLMQKNQTLSSLTSRLIDSLTAVCRKLQPDWIVAQGDTTTTMAASLVAFYARIRFAHVEAGLRTGNLDHPFPEEANRRIADLLTSLAFAPTRRNCEALINEGVPAKNILITGNTVVDALRFVSRLPYRWDKGPLSSLPSGRRLVLVTAHRRESFGGTFRQMCLALRELAGRRAGKVHFVYPVHPNPNVYGPAHEILGRAPNISLLAPLDYPSLVNLMAKAALVLTDSGGIQEEAPTFGVPVLVMRETTERPEGIEAGVCKLVGTSRQRILREASRVLSGLDKKRKKAIANPYGDGRASVRIIREIIRRA
ncbi:MAG: UDP-N-acetylglucosamine 2-epimerase (non-hydrolyzing) [Verrucomicrobiae bacterium]|nr:UDP-N-acetylglucosamine 2-epimerase (non-hydrolyzing) [Verrucomicrobiae bacterium]